VVQFAHRRREVRSEFVALFRSLWVVDERLDEDPVGFELAYQSPVVARERVSRNESLPTSLIAIGERVAPWGKRAVRLAPKIERAAVGKPELLESREKGLLPVVPQNRKMEGRRIDARDACAASTLRRGAL
jgi:hypothetical protein